MTKQEEVREGMLRVLVYNFDKDVDEISKRIIRYLHSQGVVIKVGRELPDQSPTQLEMDIHRVLIKYLNDMIDLFSATNVIGEIYSRAGYVAVESLIKEG